jgi:hypothetical protein
MAPTRAEGRKIRIPTAKLADMLGLPTPAGAEAAEATS